MFAGEVVDIAYAEVELGRHGLVPHTFVTYRIDEPLKGGRAGEEVTLRFVGGETPDGGEVHVSHVPEFAVGERDLLFVGPDNGRVGCPLVRCESGRLPLRGAQITAPTGHVLVARPDGSLVFDEPDGSQRLRQPDPADQTDEARERRARPLPARLGEPLLLTDFARRAVRPGLASAASERATAT